MASESEYDIVPQPGDTCPMIDAVLTTVRETGMGTAATLQEIADEATYLRDAEDREKFTDKLPSRLVYQYAYQSPGNFPAGALESMVVEAEKGLEEIRTNASRIREWGQDWKEKAKGLIAENAELQDKIEALEKQVAGLEYDKSNLQDLVASYGKELAAI